MKRQLKTCRTVDGARAKRADIEKREVKSESWGGQSGGLRCLKGKPNRDGVADDKRAGESAAGERKAGNLPLGRRFLARRPARQFMYAVAMVFIWFAASAYCIRSALDEFAVANDLKALHRRARQTQDRNNCQKGHNAFLQRRGRREEGAEKGGKTHYLIPCFLSFLPDAILHISSHRSLSSL